MQDLSFQLYSAREFPPIEKTLELLSGLGYTQVEPFIAQYENPQAFTDLSEKYNLKIPTGHFFYRNWNRILNKWFKLQNNSVCH